MSGIQIRSTEQAEAIIKSLDKNGDKKIDVDEVLRLRGLIDRTTKVIQDKDAFKKLTDLETGSTDADIQALAKSLKELETTGAISPPAAAGPASGISIPADIQKFLDESAFKAQKEGKTNGTFPLVSEAFKTKDGNHAVIYLSEKDTKVNILEWDPTAADPNFRLVTNFSINPEDLSKMISESGFRPLLKANQIRDFVARLKDSGNYLIKDFIEDVRDRNGNTRLIYTGAEFFGYSKEDFQGFRAVAEKAAVNINPELNPSKFFESLQSATSRGEGMKNLSSWFNKFLTKDGDLSHLEELARKSNSGVQMSVESGVQNLGK